MNPKFRSNLAFIDLLFNVLIGFVILFVIAFLMINPIQKKGDVPIKAEILFVLTWEDESQDDIDIWVQHNSDRPVGFNAKSSGLLHLERDDLGIINDYVVIDGIAQILQRNSETITLRGIDPGDFYVNIHVYRKNDVAPVKITMVIMDLNPFREVYAISFIATVTNQIFKLPAITINSEGKVVHIFDSERQTVQLMRAPTVDSMSIPGIQPREFPQRR